MREHIGEVVYTRDDDGIWLMCGGWLGSNGCGWEKCLGFNVTPEDVATAWAGHLADVKDH